MSERAPAPQADDEQHPAVRELRRQDKARLMALTDGVFAIIMTILVLGLTVPKLEQPQAGDELFWELLQHWPLFVSYVISFVVLGVYWVAHHNIFHFVTRVDRNTLWLNVLFLMPLSLFPYPVQLIGRYNLNPLAQALYGLDLVAISSCFFLLWRYQVRQGYIIDAMDAGAVRRNYRSILFPAFAYSAGILLDLLGFRHVSLGLYFVIPALYVTPGLLEKFLSAGGKGAGRAR